MKLKINMYHNETGELVLSDHIELPEDYSEDDITDNIVELLSDKFSFEVEDESGEPNELIN